VLVDERDLGTVPRVLFTLEHAIQDASLTPSGDRRTISRRMLYVEMDSAGQAKHLHYAPYLDYRPLADDEPSIVEVLERAECEWITRELEQRARNHAIATVVPEHITEIRDRRLKWIGKTRAAVLDRLTKEITHWDHRAAHLKLQEEAGKAGARLNSSEARRRADELQVRLQRRLAELDREAQVSALPPVVVGGLVVVPRGLLALMTGAPLPDSASVIDTQESAARARRIVMDVERSLGFEPTDRELEKLGYDVESRVVETGRLRFIEVKGRIDSADSVMITRQEVITSLHEPEKFILAIVQVEAGFAREPRYVRGALDTREPPFEQNAIQFNMKRLLDRLATHEKLD